MERFFWIFKDPHRLALEEAGRTAGEWTRTDEGEIAVSRASRFIQYWDAQKGFYTI